MDGGEAGGERGFSLIELVVAAALLLVMLGAVYAFVPLGGRTWEQTAAVAEAFQHVRMAMEEVVHELQYASEVRADREGQVITYCKWVGGEKKTYRIYRAGTQLLLDLPAGTAVPLGGGIERMELAQDGLLRPGERLDVALFASWTGCSAALRSSVVPRNVGTER